VIGTPSNPRLTVPVSTSDHTLGAVSAPVALVEYGDFECPHCRRVYHVVKALEVRLGPQMRVVYRHFPLTTVHPHAFRAAEAAEAAGAQGAFWAIHDMLFEHQESLDEVSLVRYAAVLGLERRRFVDELERGVHAPRVREQFMSGVRSGVNGTPTLFINGFRHNGGHDFDSLFEAVQRSLAAEARHRPVARRF
jgi:protein-disulfide isomerase